MHKINQASNQWYVLDMTSILSNYDVKFLLEIVNLIPAFLSRNLCNSSPIAAYRSSVICGVGLYSTLFEILPPDKVRKPMVFQ